jgi:undecaprenyl diphosphate synthase
MRDSMAQPDDEACPRHVAIIMDGNGRWAARRGLSRYAGHQRGVEALRGVVEACPDLGIKTLTLFAFSTENWRRPRAEIESLMLLFRRYLRRESAELVSKNVRVRFIGDRTQLADDIQAMMGGLEAQTAGCDGLCVVVAVNYGGRADIVAAARALAGAVRNGDLAAADIDEACFASMLSTAGLSDPDLVIRTSGEQRISNFLLWQCAYAEFVFAPELWPDFDRDAFERALGVFRGRQRRFGAVAG